MRLEHWKLLFLSYFKFVIGTRQGGKGANLLRLNASPFIETRGAISFILFNLQHPLDWTAFKT